MTTSIGAKARRALLAAAAIATVSVAAAPAAYAQSTTLIPGVTGCDAPGGQQTGGALIGALLGGALGNRVADDDRTAGTVVGAALGAGVGSYVGCNRQRARERQYGYDQPNGYDRSYGDARYARPAYAPRRPAYQDVGYNGDSGYDQPGYTNADERYVEYQPRHYARHPVRRHHQPCDCRR